jgi:glutaredoxin
MRAVPDFSPSRDRCEVHDVALRPNGSCVLCGRKVAPGAGELRSGQVIGGLLLLLAGFAAVGYVVRERRRAAPEAPAQVAAVEGAVPIRFYTTKWCPACSKARSFMKSRGITYTELDVESDAEARRTFRTLSPRGSVPTIDVDGEVLVGFAPDSLLAAIQRSAQRKVAR